MIRFTLPRRDSMPRVMPLLLAVAMLLPHGAWADNMILSLDPSTQSTGVGGTATLDLDISGVNASTAAIGGFDLVVNYNPAIVSLSTVNFGALLGDGVSTSYEQVNSSSGAAEIIEFSFLDPAVLATEPSSFTLANLSFTGLAGGTSAVSLISPGSGGAYLSDAYGNPLSATLTGAQITVTGASPVPEPGALWLMVCGLLAGAPLIARRPTPLGGQARP
jgi:hypothetical protein